MLAQVPKCAYRGPDRGLLALKAMLLGASYEKSQKSESKAVYVYRVPVWDAQAGMVLLPCLSFCSNAIRHTLRCRICCRVADSSKAITEAQLAAQMVFPRKVLNHVSR